MGKFAVNKISHDGWTALMYASYNGHAPIVELLLKKTDANIDATDRLFKTSLHWAARFSNLKMITVLCSKRCKLEPKDVEGMTPLDIARNYNHYDAESLLLEFSKQLLIDRETKF